MCGIIGFSGRIEAKPVLIDGLYALEYRGYDSAGISVFCNKKLQTVKTTGRVSVLEKEVNENIKEKTFCGIGHTRWATHGRPSCINAHPHETENLSLVHNGIIENYTQIKEFLIKHNYTFISETDTEVAAKLIDYYFSLRKNPLQAIREAADSFTGSYAMGIVFRSIPESIFAIKKESPLVIGTGAHGNIISSDISALNNYAGYFFRPDDEDICEITSCEIFLYDRSLIKKSPVLTPLSADAQTYDKSGFDHFMLKEIYQEPSCLKKTFEALSEAFMPDFPGLSDNFFLSEINTVHITACGTAYHAALMGKYYIENIARIPVNVTTASEFRYSEPIINKNDIIIAVSQSGETADTIAAMKKYQTSGITTVAIVNSHGSTLEGICQKIIFTDAGKEISVASTKAFSVQMLVFLLFALRLGHSDGKISDCDILKELPDIFEKHIPYLLSDTDMIKKAARVLSCSKNAFFIGRGYDSILASEGSLKLKEISYIHSEAYPAGELKHGAISLIEASTPVICIATDNRFHDKICNNILEVKARGGTVITICTENAKAVIEKSDMVITLPDSAGLLKPFTAAAAVQLLAYFTACELGRDIDKPRNLAKSVTVE